MPPPPPSKPPPLPTNHLTFDTWNSSSTGHQIADPGSSRGNTSWRETRREKLTRQFGAGRGDCTYDIDGGSKGEWVVTQIPAEVQKQQQKQQQRDIRRAGAGGGLAAGKLQKEIQRGGWKGVKLVRVQWAMDSIAAGKRLSEAKYAVQLRTNQRSVLAFTSSTSNIISSLS
ncbi:uncharacterized protein AtWU_01848 [Aspergillus tubingensis]|uniref:uncharacterized protein n=1 Tax=Aspergillus tubingensis TaxID=5068 RepID=UPI001577F5FD|nr:uncharacterized protein AtWU_01848 [Aspergillus tubingensis]GFN12051.1 hypothetical protein AtWU_01848 [Aspergillus tubingensis]